MNYKFHKGQTVYFLADPEFYDEDCDGLIIDGVITGRNTTDEICYDIKSSDGYYYERIEDYLYATMDEAKEAVNAYFAEWLADAKDSVDEAKRDLKDAKVHLAEINKRINRWKARSKQQPTK